MSPVVVLLGLLGFVGLAAVSLLKLSSKPLVIKRNGRKKRKFIIGGNWKCAAGAMKSAELTQMLNNGSVPENVEVFVAPSSPFIGSVASTLRGDVAVAAQDCGANEKLGAYTGEAFPTMLTDAGCEWAIVGHSERRQLQNESSALVAKKAKNALDNGLGVVVCIGETKEERDAGKLQKVLLDDQMRALVKCIGKETGVWDDVVIAYEPVWAIGTGVTATPNDAQETHALIRDWIGKNVSDVVKANIRIQYGGSVKGANASELAKCPDIDGFLVGSASLKTDFLDIIANTSCCIDEGPVRPKAVVEMSKLVRTISSPDKI